LNDFDNGATVGIEELLATGKIRKAYDGLRVLGEGELTKNLTVKAKAFTGSAKAKIEAAGGKVEVV
jgi:large subunit ribosomal protein L15